MREKIGDLVLETDVDTSGIDEGIEDIKDKYSDEEIITNTEKTSNGMKIISNLASKIGSKFLGISISSARILGNIVGLLAKLGIIGSLLGIVAFIGIGIAKSFQTAIEKNETLQLKMEYLKYAIQGALNSFSGIANALVKAFDWVIERIFDILALLGGVIKSITGINIFANALADGFSDANKSAGALRKTLAGFDEMNVLNDSGGTGLFGDIASDIGKIRNLEQEVESISKKIKDWFTKGLPTREELESNANIYKTAWQKVGEFLGLGTFLNDFKDRLNELKEQLRPLWQPVLDGFNDVISQVKAYFKPFTDYLDEHFIKPIKNTFTTWKDEFLSKYAKFINKLIYYANLFLQYFGIQLKYIDEESATTGEDIKENIGNAMNEVKEDSDKTGDSIKTLRERLQDLTSKTWQFVVNLVTGGNINDKLASLRKMLSKIGINTDDIKFAKGGIINLPGRGVPIASAIGGERGQEGIVPLTDSQQMALLGSTIGKYVNINATIPVYVGNRMIKRELQRIKAEDDFAYNS